ncbi:MAG: hypothetical protein P8168_02580, partial [Deltaproteobacteria bacterium]
LKAKPPEMPKSFTSSGESYEFWEARYDLNDFNSAMDFLDREEDFQQTDLEEDDHGEPIKIYYDWLERGKSSGAVENIKPQGGLTFKSFFTSGPGMKSPLKGKNVCLSGNGVLKTFFKTLSNID